MQRQHVLLSCGALVLLLLLGGCSSRSAALADGDVDETPPPDGDRFDVEAEEEDNESVWPDGDPDTEADGDLEEDAELEEDLEADRDNEPENEDETDPELADPLIDPPNDGRLYAAAALAEITPTDENHPCTQYLAGRAQDRKPQSVHTPLTARSLILAQGDQYLVLVQLDIIGLSQADTDRIAATFPPGALIPERLVIASTHTHSGPDTIGLWGPSYFKTGRCEAYIEHLARTVHDLIEANAGALVPVSVTSAATRVYEAALARPRLMRDMRYPYVYNEHLTALRLADEAGGTVATLANWHSHPEIMIYLDAYSADWPHYLRHALEQRLGGTALYVTGTLGGLLTSYTQGIEVPEWTEQGERVEVDGAAVYVKADGERKARSLGYELADYVVRALDGAQTESGALHVTHTVRHLPITNPDLQLASMAGLVAISDRLVTDKPDECGSFGCLAQAILHARIGNLHLVTLPGELFPESSVGRDASVRDYGDPWGKHAFEAISGYRSELPDGHRLIEIGLANNEIGYIVPASDFHPKDHPNYYEETSAIDPGTEEQVREAIRELLRASFAPEKRSTPVTIRAVPK